MALPFAPKSDLTKDKPKDAPRFTPKKPEPIQSTDPNSPANLFKPNAPNTTDARTGQPRPSSTPSPSSTTTTSTSAQTSRTSSSRSGGSSSRSSNVETAIASTEQGLLTDRGTIIKPDGTTQKATGLYGTQPNLTDAYTGQPRVAGQPAYTTSGLTPQQQAQQQVARFRSQTGQEIRVKNTPEVQALVAQNTRRDTSIGRSAQTAKLTQQAFKNQPITTGVSLALLAVPGFQGVGVIGLGGAVALEKQRGTTQSQKVDEFLKSNKGVQLGKDASTLTAQQQTGTEAVAEAFLPLESFYGSNIPFLGAKKERTKAVVKEELKSRLPSSFTEQEKNIAVTELLKTKSFSDKALDVQTFGVGVGVEATARGLLKTKGRTATSSVVNQVTVKVAGYGAGEGFLSSVLSEGQKKDNLFNLESGANVAIGTASAGFTSGLISGTSTKLKIDRVTKPGATANLKSRAFDTFVYTIDPEELGQDLLVDLGVKSKPLATPFKVKPINVISATETPSMVNIMPQSTTNALTRVVPQGFETPVSPKPTPKKSGSTVTPFDIVINPNITPQPKPSPTPTQTPVQIPVTPTVVPTVFPFVAPKIFTPQFPLPPPLPIGGGEGKQGKGQTRKGYTNELQQALNAWATPIGINKPKQQGKREKVKRKNINDVIKQIFG